MKTTLALLLAALATTPAFAQVLRPPAVNGAVVGGIAGAVIGHNSGDLRHNAWRGAAYGAGAGLILGSLSADAHDRRLATQVGYQGGHGHPYVYRRAPVYYSYGYGYYGRPRSYGSDVYYSYDAPIYDGTVYDSDSYDSTDYRGNGLVLGALAGAIIGNNSGGLRHNAWRGAAYGAATGYLLGALAENHVRTRPAVVSAAPVAYAPAATTSSEAPVSAGGQTPAVTPAPATTSSMTAANSLFGRK